MTRPVQHRISPGGVDTADRVSWRALEGMKKMHTRRMTSRAFPRPQDVSDPNLATHAPVRDAGACGLTVEMVHLVADPVWSSYRV